MGISKDGMLSPFANGLLNGRCHSKVHVGHPQGNDIWLLTLIPLHAAGTTPLYWAIENTIRHINLLHLRNIVSEETMPHSDFSANLNINFLSYKHFV
jgi:hypothetical protein